MHHDIEYFFDLPAVVFLKDRHGKYHAGSNYLVKMAGLDKGHDLIGTNDFDHCWKVEAPFFQLMDKNVIDRKTPLLFIENITSANQKCLKYLTYKIPLFLRSKKIMVFGISVLITSEGQIPLLPDAMEVLYKLGLGSKQVIRADKIILNSTKTNQFTQRQTECLYYLAKGMSAKQIANEIGLTQRTIEHYTDNLKIKLNCHTKAELIKKAWELDFVKARLFNASSI